MRHYIIDGDNLIGKISKLRSAPIVARQNLVKLLNNYFSSTSNNLTLFFDGYEKDFYALSKGRIEYSQNKTADFRIRKLIENTTNPKNLTVISSDNEVFNFAKVCSCESIKSEDFASILANHKSTKDDEQRIISAISINEIKDMFGV